MSNAPNPPQPPGRDPISPAKLKRLEQLFEHGKKQMTQGQHDYATDLFSQCVVGDPSNLEYLQNFEANLQKKYSNNKTGGKLANWKEKGSRAAVKKALTDGQWDEIIKHGLKVLTVNPWDKATLMAMATAAMNMGDEEPELFYLKCALEANPLDPEINRQTANSLARRQLFDQAIARWHKVEQALPNNEEAARAIASLAVQKTISQGNLEGNKDAQRFAGDQQQAAGQATPQAEVVERPVEEQIEERIAAAPNEMANYYELAQVYFNAENYEAAEEVFSRAYEASDGDIDVREKWEDAQIRRLRKQLTVTKDGPEKKKLVAEYRDKQLNIHRNRCERYPNNLGFRYDLGMSYQLKGLYNEAIREYQQARNDPRRKGVCMLALGECFQNVKQYRLAMSHYESAIEDIPDRDTTNKKKALRRAGKLALSLKDVDTAEKHLSRLAAMDFTYKDVSDLLDRIAKYREKGNND